MASPPCGDLVMPGALEGIRVLEFSELIAAPLAGMLLGDMGADVIKVEPREGESARLTVRSSVAESRAFMAVNRSKRGMAIDLKTSPAQAIVQRLVPTVDVVIVNYRPETATTLGIGYETLRAFNDRLIYVDNSAVGRRGPASQLPGYDLIVQAMSGLMASGGRGEGDIPLPINPPVIDLATGIAIAWAVCAALFARTRDGTGQKIETSLLATSLLLQGANFLQIADPAMQPPAEQDWTRLSYPYYRTWRTADGMVSVAAVTPVMRRRFEEVVGVLHPLHTQRDIPRNSPEAATMTRQFIAELTDAMAVRTTQEWLDAFEQAHVPAGQYRAVEDLVDDPQVRANDLVVDLDHQALGSVTMVGPIVRMSGTPTAARRSSPTIGQHNEEVLGEIGYSGAEVAELVRLGILSGDPERPASSH
jgi:crotonobetainyl-CoA:carnitine CoA-transferase CaiB-like acyl-CoA transferase